MNNVILAPEQEKEQEIVVPNDYDIDAFLEKRKEFIAKVNAIMKKGSDYHEIQGKKSLAKGGAEKIASIFGWSAMFQKDEAVLEAFKLEGLIAFSCTLSKHGEPVGEGRGAATLGKNGGDPNKTIKMAQKSAFIDAVLRSSGLSDFFTQDLEDMTPSDIGQSYEPSENRAFKPSKPASDKQIAEVKRLAKVYEISAKDKEYIVKNIHLSDKAAEEMTSKEASEWISYLKNEGNPSHLYDDQGVYQGEVTKEDIKF